jgi:NADPH:quinone reductase-like Zn-dependent oxidoreductase
MIHQTFPLERAADAHRMLESGHVVGKLVLRDTITSARAV